MDPNYLEALLYATEGTTHDYKREVHPPTDATDEQKAKLLKDILAFANSWKTTDAHIVIGVDDGHGQRATVIGVADHLDDAHLQQLVNSKTNVPIVFEYVPVTIDSKPCAVIRVNAVQQRPIFLTKPFGGLKADTVYVRYGSSTAPAPLAEV